MVIVHSRVYPVSSVSFNLSRQIRKGKLPPDLSRKIEGDSAHRVSRVMTLLYGKYLNMECLL